MSYTRDVYLIVNIFTKLSKKQIVELLAVVIIAIAVGLTTIISQQKQVIQQHADTFSVIPWKGNIFFGVVAQGGEYGGDLSGVTSFEQAIHKNVSIILNYYSWNITSAGTGDDLDVNFLNAVRNHGSIPMIAWESHGGLSDQAYQTRKIYSGTYDTFIRKWATDAKNWGHPFFLRFDSESNGNWVPWADISNGNSRGDFIKAWQHVHDIFVQVGATNVSWVWVISTGTVESSGTSSITSVYPGDSYVDWVGIDAYNNGTAFSWSKWQTFQQLFTPTYQAVTGMTGKPLMIGEMASAEQGGNKANWISDLLYNQFVTNFPKVHAFTWFDLNKETDWRVESSTASLATFSQAIQEPMYASNTFGDISLSPIAPLPQHGIKPAQLYADCSKNAGICSQYGLTCGSIPWGSGKGCEVPIWGNCDFGEGACASGLVCGMVSFGSQRGCEPPPSSCNPATTSACYGTHSHIITTDCHDVMTNNQDFGPSGTCGASCQELQNCPTAVPPTVVPPTEIPPTNAPMPTTPSVTPCTLMGTINNPNPCGGRLPRITSSPIPGDINRDGSVNVVDFNILVSCFGLRANTSSCIDPNKDHHDGPYLYSDLDQDGTVDGVDYNMLLRDFIQYESTSSK